MTHLTLQQQTVVNTTTEEVYTETRTSYDDGKAKFYCSTSLGLFGPCIALPPPLFLKVFLLIFQFYSVTPIFMGCGTAEATGLGFVCFVVINACVLSANRVDFGLFCFKNCPILSNPSPYLIDMIMPIVTPFYVTIFLDINYNPAVLVCAVAILDLNSAPKVIFYQDANMESGGDVVDATPENCLGELRQKDDHLCLYSFFFFLFVLLPQANTLSTCTLMTGAQSVMIWPFLTPHVLMFLLPVRPPLSPPRGDWIVFFFVVVVVFDYH